MPSNAARYLRDNEVNLDTTPAVLGPWVPSIDEGTFVNDLAKQANALRSGIPQTLRGASWLSNVATAD